MLEVTGGVSATALAFIFPAACYIHLTTPPSTSKWRVLTDRSKLPAVICVCFGLVVMVMSLGMALAKSWTSEGKAKMCV